MSFRIENNPNSKNNRRDNNRKPIGDSWWQDSRSNPSTNGHGRDHNAGSVPRPQETHPPGHGNSPVATGRKRDRNSRDPSRERRRDRDSGNERNEEHSQHEPVDRGGRRNTPYPRRGSVEPSKRAKIEEEPDALLQKVDAACDVAVSEDRDEINFLTSSTSKHKRASSSTVSASVRSSDRYGEFQATFSTPTYQSTKPEPRTSSTPDSTKQGPRKSAIFQLGRAGYSAIKYLVSGSQDATGDATVPQPLQHQLQEALEAATLAQTELEFTHRNLRAAQDECRAAQDECRGLKDRIEALKARDETLQITVHRLQTDAEVSQTERAELMQSANRHSEYSKDARNTIEVLTEDNAALSQKVEKYKTRAEQLAVERGDLKSQLKQMRNMAESRPNLKRDDISLDPFDNQVDQVSEAAVKSGVESLNDSLDTFTMALLDEAESLASRYSGSRLPAADKRYQPNNLTKLLPALTQYADVEEKRGFLLDASLHHVVLSELDQLFFAGDPLSPTADEGFTGALLHELTKREPWTVAQRWRALTATSGARVLSTKQEAPIQRCANSIVMMLAWVYRQPPETFQSLFSKIGAQVGSLFDDAGKLSILVRRDVLSVRMSVVVAAARSNGFLPYNPDRVGSVWPDMGAEVGDEAKAGDEVVTLYKFGLKKQTEHGHISYLLKPEVTTGAFLRELARS
ncbi:hypothetical protein B0H16DRAFT_430117 [Mycena metata]|uniref:Uncharacterized protein n=1 Tax=Mycena metata TaxID=1033252 RepID=A0AAD7JJW1_9AGAR|nr:hypothetical protein B0H16DRAFT_430117 [Mycena metata]